jgi:hypothetical protein
MSDLDPHEVQEAMRLAIQAGFRITKFSKASGAGFAEEHEIVALIKLARQNAIPREIHERLMRDAKAQALREAYEDLWNTEPADRMERLKQLASEHEGGK